MRKPPGKKAGPSPSACAGSRPSAAQVECASLVGCDSGLAAHAQEGARRAAEDRNRKPSRAAQAIARRPFREAPSRCRGLVWVEGLPSRDRRPALPRGTLACRRLPGGRLPGWRLLGGRLPGWRPPRGTVACRGLALQGIGLREIGLRAVASFETAGSPRAACAGAAGSRGTPTPGGGLDTARAVARRDAGEARLHGRRLHGRRLRGTRCPRDSRWFGPHGQAALGPSFARGPHVWQSAVIHGGLTSVGSTSACNTSARGGGTARTKALASGAFSPTRQKRRQSLRAIPQLVSHRHPRRATKPARHVTWNCSGGSRARASGELARARRCPGGSRARACGELARARRFCAVSRRAWPRRASALSSGCDSPALPACSPFYVPVAAPRWRRSRRGGVRPVVARRALHGRTRTHLTMHAGWRGRFRRPVRATRPRELPRERHRRLCHSRFDPIAASYERRLAGCPACGARALRVGSGSGGREVVRASAAWRRRARAAALGGASRRGLERLPPEPATAGDWGEATARSALARGRMGWGHPPPPKSPRETGARRARCRTPQPAERAPARRAPCQRGQGNGSLARLQRELTRLGGNG